MHTKTETKRTPQTRNKEGEISVRIIRISYQDTYHSYAKPVAAETEPGIFHLFFDFRRMGTNKA